MEAFRARGEFGDSIVPKVMLEATHQDALKTVSIEDLQKFAATEDDIKSFGSSGSGGSMGDSTVIGLNVSVLSLRVCLDILKVSVSSSLAAKK